MALSLVSEAACSSDASEPRSDAAPETQPDAGSPAEPARDASPEHDASGPAADAGTSAGGRRVPGNSSFETARRLEPGESLLQDLVSGSQVDYFVFSGEAGTFYELFTNRGDFTPDNTLWLYDSNHKLLAQNDDGGRWPGDAVDARLVVRLPRSGDYYVRVEDRATPDAFFMAGSFPLLFYNMHLNELTGAEGVAHDTPDGPARVHFQRDAMSGYSFATLVGRLGDAALDRFELEGSADQALIGHARGPGIEGNGSSAELTRVQVLDGERPIAQIEHARGQENIHPPVGAGKYEVRVDADGDSGDNAFYVVDLVLLPDNPREAHDEANGQLSGAEAIRFEGVGRRRGLLLSTLDDEDVDYYSFSATKGDYLVLACEGESAGSGVRGLSAELRDPGDQVLASARETATENLAIDTFEIGEAGTYFVRLSSEGQPETEPIEPWARCVVLLSP